MPNDAPCQSPLVYVGQPCGLGPNADVHLTRKECEARGAVRCFADHHPYAPPSEEREPVPVECNTDWGIEGIGLAPLQCECHRDGDPRHCDDCWSHSWGASRDARAAEGPMTRKESGRPCAVCGFDAGNYRHYPCAEDTGDLVTCECEPKEDGFCHSDRCHPYQPTNQPKEGESR